MSINNTLCGSADSDDAEQESQLFSDSEIKSALDRLEPAQPFLPFPPSQLPPDFPPQMEVVVHVDAAALHYGVAAVCVPGKRPPSLVSEDPIERRIRRQQTAYCVLTMSADRLRIRSEVVGVASEVEIATCLSHPCAPYGEVSFEVPYHFIGNLFARPGYAAKRGTYKLLYNCTEKFLRLSLRDDCESHHYLTISVTPLSVAPPRLNGLAVPKPSNVVTALSYARALRRLKSAIIGEGARDTKAMFELSKGVVTVKSVHGEADFSSEHLVGLSLRLPNVQLQALTSLLRRLGDAASSFIDRKRIYLSNGKLAIALGGDAAAGGLSEVIDQFEGKYAGIILSKDELLRGLLSTSIVTDADADKGGHIQMSLVDRGKIDLTEGDLNIPTHGGAARGDLSGAIDHSNEQHASTVPSKDELHKEPLSTSSVIDTKANDGGHIHLPPGDAELPKLALYAQRSSHGRTNKAVAYIAQSGPAAMPSWQIKIQNGLLLRGVAAFLDEAITMHISPKGVMIVERHADYRVRHGIKIIN